LEVASTGCWVVANKKESYLMADMTNDECAAQSFGKAAMAFD
jgi:hypothetical protein